MVNLSMIKYLGNAMLGFSSVISTLTISRKFLMVTQDAETPMRLEDKLSPAQLRDMGSRDALFLMKGLALTDGLLYF